MGAAGSKVPEWLSEVMDDDEVDAVQCAMDERKLEQEELVCE